MHPITIEYLARDHIADLRRDAMRTFVPDAVPDDRHRYGARVRIRIAAGFAAIARRVRGGRRVRPDRHPDPSPAR